MSIKIHLSFVLVLLSVAISRADSFSFKSVERVYTSETYETRALFSEKGLKVEAPKPSAKFFQIDTVTRDYFEKAAPIDSYLDFNGGFNVPNVIIFSGRDGKVVGVGLIVYRNRIKKSFLQMREFSLDSEGNIVIGSVMKKFQQAAAAGMELNGNFMDVIDRPKRENGRPDNRSEKGTNLQTSRVRSSQAPEPSE